MSHGVNCKLIITTRWAWLLLLWVFVTLYPHRRVKLSIQLKPLDDENLQRATESGGNHELGPTASVTNRRRPLQFVFIVGLEGTGHHFHQEIIRASPALLALQHSIPEFENEMLALHDSLYVKGKKSGLWNLPCENRRLITNYTQELELRREQVAIVLRRIQAQIVPSRSNQELLRFPVNTLVVRGARDKAVYGMCSYPNWGGKCRAQQYPRLGWFYEACAMAGVDCRHVYLYRDPIDILYSTTIRRKFNANLSEGRDLYESIVTKALVPELTRYANHSLGCVGFYENNDDWRQTIQSLWFWTNTTTEFGVAMNKIYRKPEHLDMDLSLLEGLSVETWQKSNDYLLELCREQKVVS